MSSSRTISVHKAEALANYSYLADGTKLEASDPFGGGLAYLGSLVYTKMEGSLVLESIAFNEGRLVQDARFKLQPRFYIKDHLGSVRVVADQNGEVLERNNYFPFGQRWNDIGLQIIDNRYRYNGKEEQEFLGLPYTDYGARMRNPAIPGWNGFDPLAEQTPGISPYAFCNNNPIKHVDPDGRLPVLLIPLIKGAIGAVVDAAAQVSVAMANGSGFGEALSKVDYTSVGASFVTSALAAPGMGTAAKAIVGAATVLDAAADISSEDGAQYIGGEKSAASAAVDAVSAVVPGVAVKNATYGLTKAITSDLGSKAAATLTKETKTGLKNMQTVVSGEGFQTAAGSVGDFTGGVVGGTINAVMKNDNATKTPTPEDRDKDRKNN